MADFQSREVPLHTASDHSPLKESLVQLQIQVQFPGKTMSKTPRVNASKISGIPEKNG